MSNRNCIVLVRMNEAELSALNTLQANYASTGAKITKSFLVRYGLKRLPHQFPLEGIPSC